MKDQVPNFKNLTPHSIVVFKENNEILIQIPSSGLARVEQEVTRTWINSSIPITTNIFGDVTGLPDHQGYYDGNTRTHWKSSQFMDCVHETGVAPEIVMFYIVSAMVKNASILRDDLLSPNELVRDEKGNIIGCRSLTGH